MNYYSHSELPTINFHLPKELCNRLDELINNLKHSDLDTEEKYNLVLGSIKKQVLLEPVKFEEPQIVDHYQTEKEFPSTYENPWGGSRKVFVVTVQFNFKGGSELFQYSPNGYKYSSSDIPHIYQPSGNSVQIEIDTFAIDDKNKIIQEAHRHFNLTKRFVLGNNDFIQNFNTTFEPLIEQKLKTHKDKVESLYK